MKVLFITADPLEYNSSANMRNRAIIKGIIENGNEVSTLSAALNVNSIYSDNNGVDLKLKKRYWIQDIIKINVNKEDKSRTIKRKIKEILYNIYIKFSIYDPKKRLLKKINTTEIEEEFDLIISSSDPKSVHLLAEKLIMDNPKITKKWIQYWGDPFASDINQKVYLPNKLIRKEEERLIALCDKVVYVSPFTLDKQMQLYPKYSNKMTFLPIPYIKEKIYVDTQNIKTTLGYFGDYNFNDRNIIPLYKAISKNTEIELNICGNSNLKLENKENIKIRPRQNLSVIEILEEKSDILVCVCNKHGTQIPGKAYHYAATNKAILIIVDGENQEKIKKYFESYNRYYICENNENAIIDMINKIQNNKMEYQPSQKLLPQNIAKEMLYDSEIIRN